MPKFKEYLKAEQPVTGESKDLTEPETWIKAIMGVLFLVVVFFLGTAAGNRLTNWLEGLTGVSEQPSLVDQVDFGGK